MTPTHPASWLLASTLLMSSLSLSACHVWSEIHGPTVGAGIEFNMRGEVSPALEVGYAYQRHQPLLSVGGGGYVSWSLRDGRVDLIAQATGHAFPLPLPVSVSFVTAWSPALGWALGFDASIKAFWFYPHAACYELSLSEGTSTACSYTNLGTGDSLEPPWVPSVEVRISQRYSLARDDHWIAPTPALAGVPPPTDASERAWFDADPLYISVRMQNIIAGGLLAGRPRSDYARYRWFDPQ